MPLTIVIDLDPNIVRIGPLLITWHGVFAVLGILAAARLGFWLLGKDVPNLKGTGDGLAWMVVLGLIGARLLYVWENFRLFAGGQLLRIFALTEGGISQWGGLFGAMIGAYIWARRTKFSYWKMVDAGGPAVHPEVAYEMLLCLLILGALLPFHQRLKQRLPAGVLGLIYFAFYAAGRFVLSFLRTDPAVFIGLRQAQIASALMVAIAIIAVPILLRRAARGAEPAEARPSRA